MRLRSMWAAVSYTHIDVYKRQDKECDDSKKKELSIVEDEDTAGGILSYEELEIGRAHV